LTIPCCRISTTNCQYLSLLEALASAMVSDKESDKESDWVLEWGLGQVLDLASDRASDWGSGWASELESVADILSKRHIVSNHICVSSFCHCFCSTCSYISRPHRSHHPCRPTFPHRHQWQHSFEGVTNRHQPRTRSQQRKGSKHYAFLNSKNTKGAKQ